MSMTDVDPDFLLAVSAKVRAGDADAYRQLFDALYGPLRRFAWSLVRDDAQAEDLVQEAFVRLWDRRASMDGDIPLRAWLYRTVRNLALNSRRDQATRTRLLDDPVSRDNPVVARPTPTPEDLTVDREINRQLSTLVQELPPRQREALLLSRVEGLSHVEVANTMGCAPRTVNNHLVAALNTLRRRLAELGTLVASLVGMLS